MKTQLTTGREDSTFPISFMSDNELHCRASLWALSDAAISAAQDLHISHMTLGAQHFPHWVTLTA